MPLTRSLLARIAHPMRTFVLAGVLSTMTAHAAPIPPIVATPGAVPAFVQQTTQWRQQRLDGLRAPDGWLSLVGLHWIEPGRHTLGSAAGSDLHLNVGPAALGTLTLSNGKSVFNADPSAAATIDGKPATGAVTLRTDTTDDPRGPSIVAFNHGSANFQVIERAGKFALRVKDANASTRTHFSGLTYYDADPAWRIVAKFEPHPKGRTMPIASVINTIEPMANPGVVVFAKDGKTYRLEALDEGDGQLFLIFADRTSGKTTYGAGRFLYADPPKDGVTVVDFNRSYNPPCVFTHYATCPLPPPENRLDLSIAAGEKKYAGPLASPGAKP
ncbi:MAG: DUF1684 domain-containing protein [Proteobacteria bacterium]|nr:DUF1684 domain-containing protein [Pseudomonadota bacterium]